MSDQDVQVAHIEDLNMAAEYTLTRAAQMPRQSRSSTATPLPPITHKAPGGFTNERGLARVVDVQQVAVEVEMGVAARLDGGVGGLRGGSAGRKVELCEDGERGEGDARDALCGELGRVLNDLLDVRVGGTVPVGDEGCHCGVGGWARVKRFRVSDVAVMGTEQL